MANNIVQLTDYDNNNIYPIAGAAAQGSITKAMLDEGVFVGAELTEPNTVAYVAEGNIQDDAVTTSKIADGAVTSDKIDWTTLGANYIYDSYDYLGTTSHNGSPAISGTYTANKTLFTGTITAKKSGVFFCYATMVGYCASGGTAFLVAAMTPSGGSSTIVGRSAFPPADNLANGKGESREFTTGFFVGTKGTTYTYTVSVNLGNASSVTAEGLNGASWGCIEL